MSARSGRTPRPARAVPPGVAALLVLLLAVAAGAPPVAGATSAWQVNEQSRVRMVSPYRVAPATGELLLGLEVRVAPGWHVYWKNSGDAGFPPTLDFSATPEVVRAELLWPAPERYELPGDLVAFGYEDEVVYPVAVTLDAGAAPAGSVVLAAELDYLVCEIDCIPYSYRLELEQPVAAGADGAVADEEHAALLEAWRRRVPRAAGELPGVATSAMLVVPEAGAAAGGAPHLEVTVDGAGAAPGAAPQIFLESHELFDTGRPELETAADGALRFRVPLAWRQAPERRPEEVAFAWTVTGLADAGPGTMAIEERATVRPVAAGSEAAVAVLPDTGAEAAGTAWLRAATGALALGLTPAFLALGVLIATGGAAGRRRRAAAAAAGAAAGAIVLGLLALPFQSPALAAALAVGHLAFSLRLWGLLGGDPDAPPAVAPAAPAGPFVAGGFAAAASVLAWPLPPIAEVAGTSALAGAAPAATTVLLAAGLGAPLALFALLPGGGAGRSAAAAAAARGAAGFLPLVTVVWLLYRLSRQIAAPAVAAVELALLGTALAVWLAHGAQRSRRRAPRLLWLAVAATAAGAAVWAGAGA